MPVEDAPVAAARSELISIDDDELLELVAEDNKEFKEETELMR